MSFPLSLELSLHFEATCSHTNFVRTYVGPRVGAPWVRRPFSASSIFRFHCRIFHLPALAPSGFGYLSRCRGQRYRFPRRDRLVRHFPAHNAFGIYGFSGFPRSRLSCRYRHRFPSCCLPWLSRFGIQRRRFPSPASLNVRAVFTTSTSAAFNES